MVAPTIYDFIRGGLFWVAIIFLSKYARAWWNKPGTKSRAEQAEDDPNALLRIIERHLGFAALSYVDARFLSDVLFVLSVHVHGCACVPHVLG